MNMMKRPSTEWLRCGEGFELTGKKETCKEFEDRSRSSQQQNSVKPQRRFGQKWIQSEELLQISGCASQKPRNGSHFSSSSSALKLGVTSSSAVIEDPDRDFISWNNSDSDTEGDKKQETFSLPPVKRLQTSFPAQKTKQRRKYGKSPNVSGPLQLNHAQSDEDVTEDEISLSASESEEENYTFTEQGKSNQPSGCASPALQIEYIGSPDKSSFSTPEKGNGFIIRDPEDEAAEDDYCMSRNRHTLLQNPWSPGKDAGPEGTPSISSCASSQRTGESDVSPGLGGLRASEWARQVAWETTPTKQPPVNPQHQGDSGKKRKKFAKGGLAEQLSRILQREKSARSMWQHQHKADAISQGAGSKRVSVKVTSLETVYGLQLAKCTIVGNPSFLQHSANAQCFVLFQSLSSKHKAVLQQGATVHICPPWQQVDTSAGRTLLCTRYHVSHCTSEQSQDREMCGDDRAVSLSSSPVVGHGSWMCPCSADSSIPAARCPAHLFPFLPSSITQTSPATQHSKQSRAGRTLHTVTSTERAPKVTFTLNTLLESIEKAPAGDRLLPTFQATVLRVFREQQEAGSLRYSLLMEDSQGTVAVVSGVGQVCDVEGRLCGFSCLRVHSRTNPDRDPALFSVVGEVWSHTARAAVASQDSGRVTHSDDSQVSLQSVAQPPGFCYLLEVDRGACSVLEGGEWLTMPPTHPSTLPPPLPLTPLSQALQNKRQSSRLCILCKFLHFSEKKKLSRQVPDRTADHHSGLQNTWILSLTDHSLQRGHPSVSDSSPQNQGEKATSFQAEDKDDDEDSKLPAFVRVEVRQDCCTSGIGWECGKFQKKQPVMVLLRDVWFVNGSWIADKYCSLTSTEIDSAEAVVLRGRVDSDVYRAVSQCTVSFPNVCASSQAHSLVSVSGRIQSVDEKSAFSWEECDGCGSDQLAVRTGLQSLTCLSCGKSVSSPVQRMKMDITVLSNADPSVSVTISLQQSTIQELLPDEEEEEGYDVDCVLNKELGPVNCFITSTTGTAITAVQLSC